MKALKKMIPLALLAMLTACQPFSLNKSEGENNPNPEGEPEIIEPVVQKDAYTVLIYMCGSNLESDYANQTSIYYEGQYYEHDGIGLATSDINEILSVSNQPNDINIVIETGGAKKWTNNTYGKYGDYSIDASKLQRHHVKNGKIVLDDTLTYASMGKTSTLQSFLEYGLSTYPAEKTALILWNHGGGLQGVCFDEKSSDDSLTANEVINAVSGALSNVENAPSKLEWIGYDACLMGVQDIAEKNSEYFKYMIASQESEAGAGWDYDNWIDDLYAKKDTETILKAICDSFIADNNYDDYGNYTTAYNDQTLAYYNLAYAAEYKNAWESMAQQLSSKLSNSNKSSFASLVKSCKHYADTDYEYYGLFDAKDFINKLANNSTFKPASSYTTAVLNAHAKFVPYAAKGAKAGNSNGVSLYWAYNSNTSYYNTYTNSVTNFTNWCSMSSTYGGISSGSGWHWN